jgi:hypothetical protein
MRLRKQERKKERKKEGKKERKKEEECCTPHSLSSY